MEVRTLCYDCKSSYESAGYYVRFINNQIVKGRCDICSKAGFEYKIEKAGNRMCPHVWQKVNDVCVCVRCGLTKTHDGKILFDKKIVNYKSKKKKKR